MSVPRGWDLVTKDLVTHRWSWRGLSYRGQVARVSIVDHHQVSVTEPCVWTVLHAGQLIGPIGPPAVQLFAAWADGRWSTGWARHPDDPAAVPLGARTLRPLVRGEATWPRWTRPDLGDDEDVYALPTEDGPPIVAAVLERFEVVPDR